MAFYKWIKNRYFLVLEVTIVIVCSIIIFQSDRFQERLSPRKYWISKVKELEGDVRIDHWKIRSLELSLEKEKAAGQYAIQAAIDHAKSFGKDVEEISKSAVIKYEEKLMTLQKDLEISKKTLTLHANQLQKAQSKLGGIN